MLAQLNSLRAVSYLAAESALRAEAVQSVQSLAPEQRDFASALSVWVPESAKQAIDLAEYSNRDAQLAVSNTEQANRDARSIEEANILKLWQPDATGDAAAASNRDFVKAFARAVGDEGIIDN